jgi:membrane-associated phospholipid phosphatase
MVNIIQKANTIATKAVYKNIGDNSSNLLKHMPRWLGLIPYELYVLPGMFLALGTMLWTGSITPLQFHLLPHWFAFSIFTYIKHNVHRERPGCRFPDMSIRDSPSHCDKARFLSFPSGHTGICFALATSLSLTLLSDRKLGKLFGLIDYDNKNIRYATLVIAYIVCVSTAIHRVSYGYHYVGDTIIGALIGMSIGYISYHIIEQLRGDKEEADISEITKTPIWNIIKYVGVLFCGIAILHFFLYNFKKLADIQH